MSEGDDIFVTAIPLETSGSRSANRTDYQKDWALCRLLCLHESDRDYLLLLEYHDDVAIFDSPSAPTKVQFFQVKTAGKPWTMNSLTKRPQGKKGPKPSILGKLFYNGKLFKSVIEKLTLVSNARFNVKTKDGPGQPLTNICFVQVSEEERNIAVEKLKLEIGELPSENIVFFSVDDLSVNDHATHTRGKVSSFLEKAGYIDVAVGPTYRTLADEIRRRADYEGNWLSLEDLASKKGISRSEFDGMLRRVSAARADRDWEQCRIQLGIEGTPFSDIQQMHRSWKNHEVCRMDAANLGIQRFRRDIARRLEEELQSGAKRSLTDLIAKISPSLVRPPTYSDMDVRAAIVLEAYASEQCRAVQEAHKKPEDPGT